MAKVELSTERVTSVQQQFAEGTVKENKLNDKTDKYHGDLSQKISIAQSNDSKIAGNITG
jgi:hypothetical protein